MASVDHQGNGEGLQWVKRAHEHVTNNELKGTRKDRHGHEHRVHKGETQAMHVDAIGHAQEEKARKDGNRVGKGRPERDEHTGAPLAPLFFEQPVCPLSRCLIHTRTPLRQLTIP